MSDVDKLLRSHLAPPPRTLIDVLQATAQAHPDAAAIDDGEVITYAELIERVREVAAGLHRAGMRRGDRIGVRMTSGTRDLYLAILGTMWAGCAYVPVDADDPDERAEIVFGQAGINGIFTDEGFRALTPPHAGDTELPGVGDDCWIIFTSGSTGTPKGVAVTHRSAAAFVDAEARLFCRDEPLGPEDRVLAGLSVAFDASCEEMWLAWGHGACLVPAPRSLVRSGQDLGPWLIRRDISVVSTVPTLAGLWPAEALDNVRLLIVGGEACSQELVDRLATPEREMWNTYGPTEATVVASAARLYPGEPVTIGWALDGWDLAVDGSELVIGGVGLARYLDPAKDAEKYAPLGDWERAYRTGDNVRVTDTGLAFIGRADDQVKIGGRRIELGEVEANVASLPRVYNSAVAVQTTGAGDKVLVGYVSLEDPEREWDIAAARERLGELMPAALVPRLHVMDELPVRTSGKVDKKALPWPLPAAAEIAGMTQTEAWLAGVWLDVLGAPVESRDADFFALGGSSLAAATLVARLRERVPTIAVRDLYDHPRLEALAEYIDSVDTQPAAPARERTVAPVGAGTRAAQTLIQVPVMTLQAATYVTWWAIAATALGLVQLDWVALAVAFVVLCTPLGRLHIGALGARLIRGRIAPGEYPRGGRTHLRLWAAERWIQASGALNISGSTWVAYIARLLGATVGRGVDMHTLPPTTGLLTLGAGAAIEQEVDLTGYWLDGDTLRVGEVSIGADARVGARSTLMPGTRIHAGAHVEAGSTVTGDKAVKKGARWAGSPARKVGRSKHRFPDHRPARRPWWVWTYALTALGLALMPVAAGALGIAAVLALVAATGGHPAVGALLFAPVGGVVYLGASIVMTWLGVRVLSRGIHPGVAPVRSAQGWKLWTVTRLLDDARTRLFPLYAGALTPAWLRSLGARVGRDAEISTAVMVPRLTTVKDGAFLADDTLVGTYELGHGWVRTAETTVGKRAFVGNSGITGPGRKLAKNSLVAVLSSTPKKSKAGSNWWGSPPERMRRVEVETDGGEALTYRPSASVKRKRGVVETMRLLAPMGHAMIVAAFLVGVHYALVHLAFWAYALGGLIFMACGAAAVAMACVAKWVCVGAHRPGDHPLYSWFVWLNELQDQFIELVAAPWFFNHSYGTGEMNMALRTLGVRVGRGAWIESYWFPETDLCSVGAGASVGPGTVVQTHLFQDRVMSLDTVTIEAGATLAAHSVALPASTIGEGASVRPGSLLMRGDQVPAGTQWQGNPIEPVG
ncbi:Pls/PosA family non-ribosomal peptide synthetase [Corynebacterium auris]|uniref:Pls/PosA family non-ribosomal peptide synthetase n=1 Tax=Corynebacterium auris TaxID=44750 RepID=UPI0025B38FEA|nr:Pls/PosA family non-ribosomal peptide synthetase [Corynebacterium auris]WJY68821.1 Surfactin synthase subunit 1 [Corynebacterium auris]